MARPNQREAYVTRRELILPELRMLGWNSNRSARDLPLDPHEHRDAFEICYIARGSVEWWVRDETYEVGPGDLYVTKPREPHGGIDAVIHPCDLYWVGIAHGDAPLRPALRRLAKLERRCFPGSPAIISCFERLLAEHRRRDALSVTAARAALHELVVTVLRDHDEHGRRADSISPQVRAALDWMTQNLTEDLRVEDFAGRAGLSVTQFHDRFRREVGFTPGEWRTRQRVRLAKSLLRRPELSITDVAMRTGFSTSQYFATAFKKLVGLTPGEYRRNAASAQSATNL